MATRASMLLGAMALATLMLAMACSHMTPAALGPEQAAELQQTSLAAQAGNGFVCDGATSTYTCFCKKGATGPFSCSGMDRLCRVANIRDLLGRGLVPLRWPVSALARERSPLLPTLDSRLTTPLQYWPLPPARSFHEYF